MGIIGGLGIRCDEEIVKLFWKTNDLLCGILYKHRKFRRSERVKSLSISEVLVVVIVRIVE